MTLESSTVDEVSFRYLAIEKHRQKDTQDKLLHFVFTVFAQDALSDSVELSYMYFKS